MKNLFSKDPVCKEILQGALLLMAAAAIMWFASLGARPEDSLPTSSHTLSTPLAMSTPLPPGGEAGVRGEAQKGGVL